MNANTDTAALPIRQARPRTCDGRLTLPYTGVDPAAGLELSVRLSELADARVVKATVADELRSHPVLAGQTIYDLTARRVNTPGVEPLQWTISWRTWPQGRDCRAG